MKKIGLVIISLLLGIIHVNAEVITLTECEYTDEYIKWYALSEEEKEKTVMPTMCKMSSNTTVGASNNYTLSYYNLADYDYVLGVRNQETTSSCWAFAASSAIESNLLVNGYSTDYLSPAHMEFMTQNTRTISGLKTFMRTINTGGTKVNAAAYVLNYWGPVAEDTFPLEYLTNYLDGNTSSYDYDTITSMAATVDVDDILYLTSSQGACSSDMITAIKKYITTNGAMTANVYWDSYGSNLSLKATGTSGVYILGGDFINGAYYYYSGSAYTDVSGESVSANQLINHAVTIVGWDDDIDTSNFSSYNTPTSKGAWIVKNSYGLTDDSLKELGYNVSILSGDEGYYYISYEDINICTDVTGYYNTSLDLSDYVYSYDYLGWDVILTANYDTLYTANLFSKQSSGTEVIDKVTFGTTEADVDYIVYYANSSLTSLTKIASGTTTGAGYTSVNLDDTIYVDDNYGIVVEFIYTSDDDYSLPASMAIDDTQYEDFVMTSNVSYISINGINWADFEASGYELQASIKAYTSTVTTTTDNNTTTTETNTTTESNTNTSTTVDTSNTTVVVEENEANSTLTSNTTGSSTTTTTEEIENPQTGVGINIFVISLLAVVVLSIYKNKKKKLYRI